LIRVQAQIPGKLLEIVFIEGTSIFSVLIFIQEVVILPECILLGRTFGSLGCPQRLGTQECEMNIGKLDLSAIDVILFDLTPRVSGESPTERSLKITKLD
jgi:hypothetical protein